MTYPIFKSCIVVFARLPVPGKAKTRLAASVGNEAAAEFYKLCAEQTFHSAYSCQTATAVVFCSAATEVAAMQDWLQHNNTPMQVHAQQATADLGQRMLAALTAVATGVAANSLMCGTLSTAPSDYHSCSTGRIQQQQGRQVELTDIRLQQQQQQQQQQEEEEERKAACVQAAQSSHCTDTMQQQQQQQQVEAEGEKAWGHTGQSLAQQFDAVLVVGTDIPDLTADVLDQAVALLNTYDMVLGPARDGGFYLMGFRSQALLNPDVQSGRVFESVEWSTETVLQRTAAGVEKIGLNLAPLNCLPVLQDIDILESLQAWFAQATAAVEMGEPMWAQQQQQQSGQQVQSIAAAAAAASDDATGDRHSSSSSSTDSSKELKPGLQRERAQLLTYVKSLLNQDYNFCLDVWSLDLQRVQAVQGRVQAVQGLVQAVQGWLQAVQGLVHPLKAR